MLSLSSVKLIVIAGIVSFALTVGFWVYSNLQITKADLLQKTIELATKEKAFGLLQTEVANYKATLHTWQEAIELTRQTQSTTQQELQEVLTDDQNFGAICIPAAVLRLLQGYTPAPDSGAGPSTP